MNKKSNTISLIHNLFFLFQTSTIAYLSRPDLRTHNLWPQVRPVPLPLHHSQSFFPAFFPIHFPLSIHSHSPPALSPFKVLSLSLLGLERGRSHSISPSVSQEPEIPARDAIWYKSIIMKVQHGAKWVSTSAARGANDKTASLCSLACR